MNLRWRLFPKYATLIIALVGGMLVVSGGISLYFSYRENQDHLFALQREKAQAAAARIEQYIRSIEHGLGWTALPQGSANGNAVDQRRFEYLKLLRQAPAITEVTWIDAGGREQLKVSRLAMDVSGANADRSKDPSFVEAKAGRIWYSPVYFRKETEPYMTISRPAGNGGVTVAEVNLKFVGDVVSRIKIGQAGLAFVIDSSATLIAHPDISLVLQKTHLAGLAQVAALTKAPDAEEDAAATAVARDLKGVEVITANARIPTLGWTVFVELPLAEAFKPIYASIQRMGLLLLAGLVASMLASFFLARLMVRPIRALQEGAAQIGAGNLDQEIAVTTGDELESLAGQFNRMAAQLKESYAGLERKVEERTAELRETLDYQTATAEILHVISSSPTDVQPVFDTIAERAARLCEANFGFLFTLDDGLLHIGSAFGLNPEIVESLSQQFPRRAGNDSIAGRAVSSGAVIHVANVLAEPGYALKQVAEMAGYHACVGVPMSSEGKIVGAITVLRPESGPFSDKQVELLKTFASQAGIAIQNVRLFHEIQEKNLQLEIAGKHKSEFLANMSHELRTPLNAIIGFSEVLLERMFGEMNEKQEDYLKDIHSSGQHLLSLINDILDLAKVEAGRMELNLATFHLPTAIDNALTLVRERAMRHSIALAADIDPQLGELHADERKLKQILLNLLSNAVKFTPEGGSITVAARPLADKVEIAVTDTGVGIAPDDHAAVFEEFKQVGTDYMRKSEGTGLGLALTRRLVELHGGTMHLESEPGKGSTFSFTIPLNLAAPGAAAATD